MPSKKQTVYRPVRTRGGQDDLLSHKLAVLFTGTEANQLQEQAIREDRSSANLVHYIVREYLAGRLVQKA